MSRLANERELVEGREYRIIEGFGQGEIGVCKSIDRSDFGMVWGEIETPLVTHKVRWNLLAVHPSPEPPTIVTKIGMWLCPTCGEAGEFAGFCENDNHSDVRRIYQSCFTVDQVVRARNKWVEKFPESCHTIDGFIEKIIDTPLLAYQ
jgi:hypothetical protein